jgi:hypothetical protein
MDSLVSDIVVVCIMLVCIAIGNAWYKHSTRYKYSVQKLLNKRSRVLMPIHVYSEPVVRSYVVHVATHADGRKVYMHKHTI